LVLIIYIPHLVFSSNFDNIEIQQFFFFFCFLQLQTKSNFINILHANFSYESSFSLVTFCLVTKERATDLFQLLHQQLQCFEVQKFKILYLFNQKSYNKLTIIKTLSSVSKYWFRNIDATSMSKIKTFKNFKKSMSIFSMFQFLPNCSSWFSDLLYPILSFVYLLTTKQFYTL
jgi:hypothetical protein